jgi:acetyl/propionyl-CoA carboxylase alpha subunit
MSATLHSLGSTEVQISLNGIRHRVHARRTKAGWRVHTRGRTFEITLEDERSRVIRELGGGMASRLITPEVRAPMPGLIVRLLVDSGQEVEAGDGMLVIEAMKMENELKAEGAGLVGQVHVKPGQTVDKGDLLISFATQDR